VVGAVVLGGAGSQHPLVAMIVTLLALVVVATAGDRLFCPAHDRVDRVAVWLCGLVVVLVLAQIVPLPPGLWQHLPGRAIVAAVDSAQGRASWRPLSLAPDLTLDIALALIAPVVAFGVGRSRSPVERLHLIRLVIGCAIVGALLGLGQLASGGDGGLSIWATSHAGSGVGWFVNRNHQAASLLVAIAFGGVPGAMPFESMMKDARLGAVEHGLAVGAMFVLLAAGVLATLSRTGVALLPLALALAVALRRPGRHLWFVALAVAMVATGLLALGHTAIGDALLTRYGLAAQDDRFAFWANTLHAARGFLPFGTGFGTFVGVYQMVEPLDQVGPLYVVHAHDDFLEWLLEGGWPIAAITTAALGCLFVRLVTMLRKRDGRESRHHAREITLAALGAMLVLGLASLTDFPLRMAALGVVFGLCAGFAANPRYPRDAAPRRAGGRRRMAGPAFAGVLSMLVVSAELSQDRVLAGDGAAALGWAGWRARAWSLRGQARLQQGQRLAAGSDAAMALKIDPLDPVAVRIAGLVAQAEGQHARATVMAAVAGQLGWRDLPTQVWLAELAEQHGDLSYEVQRVDALLRQHAMTDRALDFFVGLVGEPEGRKVIVARLADSPGWAQGFFNRLSGPAGTEPEAIVALVEEARRAGVRITPDTLALVTWRLAEAGQIDAVRALRQTLGVGANLGDGDFASAAGRLPDQAGPYRWRGNAASGGEVYIGPGVDGRGQALHVISDGRPVAEALRQRLLLLPGRYRLSDRWSLADGDHAVRLQWAMRCLSSGGNETALDIEISTASGDLVIPQGCGQQDLRLDIANTTGKPFHVALQHVVIDSVHWLKAG
jgi:O-antigen ligase